MLMNALYLVFHRTLLLFACVGFATILMWYEANAQERIPQHPKIEQFLNPDGTLNTSGFPSSSVDARGWKIETRRDRTLRFTQAESSLPFYARPAAPGDEYWDDRFGANPGSSGVDDEIFAMASDGKHLYVGGIFSKVGSKSVNSLAAWDGEEWSFVGPGPDILNGVNGFVYALAVDGETLFVGGQFDTAGAQPIRNVALYDILTKSWRNIGGISSTSGIAFVSSIVVDGDNVYVGGAFDRAGGVSVKNVAVYSRSAGSWRALGSGVEGSINAIALGYDGLYVGGDFSSAGGVATTSIARWDGSQWHGLAGGVNGFVNAIAVMDSTVFVAGGFDRAGDTVVSNIARWRPDTATWTRLTAISWLAGDDPIRLEGNGVDNVVRSLTVSGKELYVGGTFITAFPGDFTETNLTVRYVARWREFEGDPLYNTSWWGRLGKGMNGFVNALTFHKDGLYAAGVFNRAGGQLAEGIARWDGLRWFNLRTGTGNNIFAMAVESENVWVGGEFNQPGTGIGTRLARLNGRDWELVPGAFSGNIYTVAIKDEWIYVGGRFDSVGSLGSSNIVRYNSTTNEWSTLGSSNGPNNDADNAYVAAIAFEGDYVYLGGDFTNVNGMPAFSLARWNSVTDTWDSVGRGINGQVFAIAPDGDDLYVGGRFLGAGELLAGPGRDARNVARWKDGTWLSMGDGVNKVVWTMVFDTKKLFAGGNFDSAGTMPVNHVVAWDIASEQWEGLGEGLDKDFLPSVSSLSTNGKYIYAGGDFAQTGFDSVSNIARWDGSRWNPLGSGVDSPVYVVDVDGNKVYVAGAFTEAGGKSSPYFGIYSDPLLSIKDPSGHGGITLNPATPNPFVNETTIRFQTSQYDHLSLKVFDIDGEQVAQLIDNPLPAGEHRIVWEADQEVASGVYVVRLEIGDEVLTEKVIKN